MLDTHLGMFEVTSGNIIVSDPSSGCNESFKEWVANDHILSVVVKNGFWSALMKSGERNLEGRVASLLVHTGELVNDEDKDWLALEKLFVTSGQAGIFDFSRYQNDYGLVYDETLSNFNNCTIFYQNCSAIILDKPYGGVIKNGVVTSASNGIYTVYVQLTGTLVTAIKIVYIEDDLADKLQDISDADTTLLKRKHDTIIVLAEVLILNPNISDEDRDYLAIALEQYESYKTNPLTSNNMFCHTIVTFFETLEVVNNDIITRMREKRS